MNHANYRTRAEMIAAGLTLDEQNEMLLANISHLKMQVDGAKAEAAAGGEYSERDWFNRASHALRMTQVEHQKCLREIGDRNKVGKESKRLLFESAFIDVARRRLDADLFFTIFAEAQTRTSQTVSS